MSCHGAEGKGDGPAGKGLDPAPADFTDAVRIAQRSAYGLYNTITLGVAGTGMAAYRQLTDDERWALAFFVSQFALHAAAARRRRGRLEIGPPRRNLREPRERRDTLHGRDHRALRPGRRAGAAVAARASRGARGGRCVADRLHGEDAAREPRSASQRRRRGRDAARADRLSRGLRADRGQPRQRRRGTAHPDRARDDGLSRPLASGASAEDAERQVAGTIDLLQLAEQKLGSDRLDAGALFGSSLLILLREGLEAILVLAAIIAFLVKSGRRDAMPWVHFGWVIALVAGAATWFVATYVVSISGASREMTEAVSALCAAVMLLYIGVWLHSKANARAWQRFLHEQVGGALGRKTLWALASVSFLAVYRELFEIVLFYQALWAQAGDVGGAPLLAGVGTAVAMLALVGWGVFRYGLRLPIDRFFKATAVMLAVLAVVFLGQGVAALQEAGAVGATASRSSACRSWASSRPRRRSRRRPPASRSCSEASSGRADSAWCLSRAPMGASRARFAVSLGVLLSVAAPTAVWPAAAAEPGRETAREAESGRPTARDAARVELRKPVDALDAHR